MDYILLDFGFKMAYQEISLGQVVRYVNVDGSTATDVPVLGDGGRVVDANPIRESWMQ